VIGYWKLPNNGKNSISHYYKYLPLTFNMLKDKNILFYSNDDSVINFVKSIAKTSNIIYRKILISDLPAFAITKDYIISCKNQNNHALEMIKSNQKGLTHYFRDFVGSGQETYRKLITIWLSKILLLNEVITENIFNTPFFAWVDASIARIPRNFINMQINSNTLNTNRGSGNFKHMTIINGAGFMIANKDVWLKIIPLYTQMLHAQKNSNYAHDEETILRLIYENHPNLFTQL